MKQILLLLLFIASLTACTEKPVSSSVPPPDWSDRQIDWKTPDSLLRGSTYLSVYSAIYDRSEHRTHELTATASIRNTSESDSLFILRADYYNTAGDKIRSYLDRPVFVGPMETIEIIIEESDTHGGTGANLLFEWAVRPESPEPVFEAVMISTAGQQGISFTTKGVNRITGPKISTQPR